MAPRWKFVLATAALALVVAAPVVYSSHTHTHLRNLRVVEEGKLYRSGQLTPAGLERVVHEYGIKTVVTLRGARKAGGAHPDAWERDFCAARGLNFDRCEPQVWGEDEKGEIPASQNVERFVQIMADPKNHPVLVHCFAGIHRTGTMCAIYRMEFQGWPAERAIAEMQLYGFAPEDMHQHIGAYLRGYERGKRR